MPDFSDTFDFMSQSTTLRRHGSKRTFFDPQNPEHVASMRHYMETGMWTVPFYCEDPFIDVPMTVFRKYIGAFLGVNVTNQQKIEAAEMRARCTSATAQREDSHEPTPGD